MKLIYLKTFNQKQKTYYIGMQALVNRTGIDRYRIQLALERGTALPDGSFVDYPTEWEEKELSDMYFLSGKTVYSEMDYIKWQRRMNLK